MKTTFAKSANRSPSHTKFATPLVLDPPRHCGLPQIQLGLGKHLIGVSPDCSVRVQAEGVAARHAMVMVSEHRTVVKALDPRTWVNEGPVSEMALRPGDRLSIGPLTFRVRAASADELADFAAASEYSFNDDGLLDADATVESLLKTLPPAIVVDESRQAIVAAPMTTAVLPVVDSTVAKGRESVVPAPIELPQFAAPTVAATVHEPSHIASSVTTVKQANSGTDATVSAPAHTADAPVVRSTSIKTLDFRLDEIEQKLADLQQPAIPQPVSTGGAVLRTDALVAESRQLMVRQDELQHRADELTRQLQQLHERVARVAEREAEVERSQARLAHEHEQLSATAETTRKELDDEYARHMTLWQEWDAAYRRTSGELNGQLQSMEQRRTALLAEADRLAGERSEIQRLQAEHERDRRVHTAERVQLTTDRAALQTLRAEFDTERQQQLVAVQEREARVAAERRTISVVQEELLGTRQQFERDRTEFLAERTAEAMRREQELREHAAMREQLDRDHTHLQAGHLEIHELRRAVETDRAAFHQEWETFHSQQAAAGADRAELSQVRERLRQVESDLERLRSTHEATRPAAALAEVRTTATQPHSLDWFAEPYKSIQLPPSVPADRRGHEPSGHGTTSLTSTSVPDVADILPLSATAPSSFDDPRQPAVETENSFADAVHGNEDVSRIGNSPQVAAPAATIHRFWEDNTLYDTSVSSHSQRSAPTSFVASSNLMMSASADTPTVAMPLAEVASGDAGSRFASSAAFDANPLENSVAIRSHSLAPVVPGLETFRSTSSLLAETLPTADETLAEVNRQFGVPLPAQESSPTEAVATLPKWWSANDATTLTTVDDHCSPDDLLSEISADRIGGMVEGDDTQTAGSDGEPSVSPAKSIDPLSLSSLRTHLAQMFDLPSHNFQSTEPDEPTEASDSSTTDEMSLDDHDCMELTLLRTANDALSELHSEVKSDIKAEASIQAEASSNLLSGTESTASEDSAPSVHDAHTAASPKVTTGSEGDDSVEAYMARLLSRTRGGAEVSASDVVSLTAAASETLRQRDASNGESPVRETTFDPADRSHLTAEPKHKQDRQAARDDLLSFRQVAHQSARSALARHTTKAQLSAVIGKSLLLGTSTLATVAFLGAPLVGMPTQFWKGLACSLAMLLSATEVYRSWQELRRSKSSGEQYRNSTKKLAEGSANLSVTASSDKTANLTHAPAVVE